MILCRIFLFMAFREFAERASDCFREKKDGFLKAGWKDDKIKKKQGGGYENCG